MFDWSITNRTEGIFQDKRKIKLSSGLTGFFYEYPTVD